MLSKISQNVRPESKSLCLSTSGVGRFLWFWPDLLTNFLPMIYLTSEFRKIYSRWDSTLPEWAAAEKVSNFSIFITSWHCMSLWLSLSGDSWWVRCFALNACVFAQRLQRTLDGCCPMFQSRDRSDWVLDPLSPKISEFRIDFSRGSQTLWIGISLLWLHYTWVPLVGAALVGFFSLWNALSEIERSNSSDLRSLLWSHWYGIQSSRKSLILLLALGFWHHGYYPICRAGKWAPIQSPVRIDYSGGYYPSIPLLSSLESRIQQSQTSRIKIGSHSKSLHTLSFLPKTRIGAQNCPPRLRENFKDVFFPPSISAKCGLFEYVAPSITSLSTPITTRMISTCLTRSTESTDHSQYLPQQVARRLLHWFRVTPPYLANLVFWYVSPEGGPNSIPMGSSIVRINDTGSDTLCVIWMNDSDEYLASSPTDSN